MDLDKLRLTDKQRRFAEAVVGGMNKTDAYLHAGYSKKNQRETIHVSCCKLAQKPNVAEYIDYLRQKARDKVIYSKQTLLEELNKIVYGDAEGPLEYQHKVSAGKLLLAEYNKVEDAKARPEASEETNDAIRERLKRMDSDSKQE